jgi:DNA-binding LacI/PurR family transcriptional regulator
LYDRAEATSLAVEHLIKLGHQRIGFLAIEDQRKQGCSKPCENNLPYDDAKFGSCRC